jgi:hypothetical protein
MRRTLCLLVAAFLLPSCGVKLPPLAPERPKAPAQLKLNCSPKDPDCDRTDPNYQPVGAEQGR